MELKKNSDYPAGTLTYFQEAVERTKFAMPLELNGSSTITSMFQHPKAIACVPRA